MNDYPDCETYKALYKRFYDGRKPEELLDLAGDLKGKTVLDLCAGDGKLSLEAAKRGANIYLIEKEKNMLSGAIWKEGFPHPLSIIPYIASAEILLKAFPKSYFDVAFCRQAINYWLDGFTAEMVANVLKKDGVFVFNTFNKKPPEKPVVKEYELGGLKFVETTWSVGHFIHHVQIREGLPPHTTGFWWISPDDFQRILSPYFDIQLIVDGNTSLYRCSRK